MKLYEFRNSLDENAAVNVTLVTDGIGKQLEFFITETPRNMDKVMSSLGWPFVAGHQTSKKELVDFAKKANVYLVEVEEGGKGNRVVDFEPDSPLGVDYVFTVDPEEVEIPKEGGSQVLTIVSEKKIAGQVIDDNVDYTVETESDAVTYSKETKTLTVTANTGEARTIEVILSQVEGNAQVTVTINQETGI